MTIFDVELRIIECPKCGAPLQCARVGGTVQCGYCHASCLVLARQPEQVNRKAPSAADEVVRMARLKEQMRHPASGHAYDMTTPPADFAMGGWERIPEAWKALKEQARAGESVDQHRVCWLAVHLADSYFRSGDEPRGRATLETAFDLLSDPAHRQLLSCRLAWEAAKRGDVNAAIGWLGECDPAPELLELDSEYRAARARLALARNLPDEVFRWLGAERFDMPVDDSHWGTFCALRVAALEDLGKIEAAIASMSRAVTNDDGDLFLEVLGATPPWLRERLEPAIAVLGMPLRAPALRRERLARKRVRAILFAAVLLGGAIAWVSYVMNYIRGGS